MDAGAATLITEGKEANLGDDLYDLIIIQRKWRVGKSGARKITLGRKE